MIELKTAQPARHDDPTVKATALAYLVFERPDLDLATRYLVDFGLHVTAQEEDAVYLRGTGSNPCCYAIRRGDTAAFIGFALEVSGEDELQKLSRIPGASAVEDNPLPGGGRRVRLQDPAGFSVEAICSREPVTALPHRSAIPHNTADETVRVNDTQRVPLAPAEITKLGHVVIEVPNYQETCAWYTRHFGFIPSDVQVLPDGSPAVTFMRLDLGDTPADHHTLAIVQGVMPGYSHSAFEVVDSDAVAMGQRVLRERGWQHAWGMGRHILGSQIFDYWQDPWGAKHEHYSDGDVFTADQPMGVHALSRAAMAQWGPEMPGSFTKPKITVRLLRETARNLRHSPDLSVKKLATMLRLLA